MGTSTEFVLEPRGPFRLRSAARFISGWEGAASGTVQAEEEAVVRLAFLVDDWTGHAGVVLRQEVDDGPVLGTVLESTADDADRVRSQAARIVSLDHDGTGFAAVGERDPVIAERQRAADWLRPVLFHSPYEAACWAVIGARVRQAQAAQLRDALSSEHGASVGVDGVPMLAFPSPEKLLCVHDFAGLSAEKVARLHGIARAALEGRLDREDLLARDSEDARARLLELRGIGPFWASGILLRAVGTTDVLMLDEPRLRRAAAAAYGSPDVIEDDEAFTALAERWRPFQTWVTVLLRATS
ncbi:MAG: DNA-3-methyladenine glycosylase family protein [Solirubrobacteraceae bacterium]